AGDRLHHLRSSSTTHAIANAICPNANAVPRLAAPNTSARPTPIPNAASAMRTERTRAILWKRRFGPCRHRRCGDRGRASYFRDGVLRLTLQQLEHGLRCLVRLREHGGTGLLEDLELREVDHLSGHVHVADAALGRGQVLLVDRQVRQHLPDPLLHGPELRTLRRYSVDGRAEPG